MKRTLLLGLAVTGLVCIVIADDIPMKDPDDNEGRSKLLGALQVPVRQLKDYQHWSMLTPGAVDTSDRQFFLCGLSTKRDQDEKRQGPHWSPAIRVYANPTAKAAIDGKSKTFPRGSVLVKEKLNGKSIDAITAMIREGDRYDWSDEKNNWRYFYVDWREEMQFGRIEACRSCHQKAKASDFAFLKYSDRSGYSSP